MIKRLPPRFSLPADMGKEMKKFNNPGRNTSGVNVEISQEARDRYESAKDSEDLQETDVVEVEVEEAPPEDTTEELYITPSGEPESLIPLLTLLTVTLAFGLILGAIISQHI